MESKKERSPLWNIIRTEWVYLGSRKKRFLFQASLFVIAGVISLLTPLVIGSVFNSIQQNITSTAELKRLILMIFLLLAISLGFWIFHGAGRIMEILTGFFVHRNYTNSKMRKVLELPVRWHKDHHSGDTIDKINRGRGAIASFSQDIFFDVIYAFLNIFGSLIILFFVDVKIASFTAIFSLIVIFTMIKMDKKLNKHYDDLNKFSNKLSAAIYDYVGNILTIITLRLKKSVAREVDNRLMASYQTHRKSSILNELKWGFADISLTLMTVLVLVYKAYSDYTTTGVILIGTLYILYGYLNIVGSTFFKFAYLYGSIVRENSKIEGAYPIDRAFEQIKKTAFRKLPPDWVTIKIEGLSFTYDQEGKIKHLDKINLGFERGQKIALIGESGSGKSTILSLIGGHYSPDKGKLYCNGIKIEAGFEKLKQHVTLVPQDPEIFNNTIKYNITMDIKIEKKDLDEVISMVRLNQVISRLDKGLNTNVLEKGVSLSGGEKQRLALARGLIAAKNSEIVLLDEPTSSVDYLNEVQIYEDIFKKFKNKTILSSVHKLYLLKNFDYIYMFDKGKIVAEGTFAELKKNPRFMRIWKKYGSTKEIK